MPIIGNRGVNLEAGEVVTLFASANRTATAGTNGTAVYLGGERIVFLFLLDVTLCDDDVDDTLDVYVDWSMDNVTYYNGIHYTQVLGNGAPIQFYAIVGPAAAGTAVINTTTDAAVSVVRPEVFGPYARGRYVLVDGGGADADFTFSLVGYAL